MRRLKNCNKIAWILGNFSLFVMFSPFRALFDLVSRCSRWRCSRLDDVSFPKQGFLPSSKMSQNSAIFTQFSSENALSLPAECRVKDLCRLCLISTGDRLEIFGSLGQEMNISKTMQLLFTSEVHRGDQWPQRICMSCYAKLTDYHDFYCTVKASEATLEGICGQLAPQGEGQKVQEETELVPEAENDEESVEMVAEVKEEDSGEAQEDTEDVESIEDVPLRRRRTQPRRGNSSKRKSLNDIIAKYVKLTCELCTASFRVFEDLKEHYCEAHDQVGYVRCCGMRFERRQRLVEHVHFHVDPKSFECQVCGKGFKFRNHLQEHLNIHIPPEQREFKCDQCPKSYTKLCRLTAHQKVHVPHEEREHVCPQCGKAFSTGSVMRSHIRIVHERCQTKVCEFCARIFKTKEAFVAHQINHMTEKPPKVQCEYCGKKFKQRPGLLRHMLRHKNPNQAFQCDLCSRTTATKRALYMHKKYVHTTQPLKCNLCDREFKRPINLKEHMASHTGQQQLYSCNFCDKMFNSNANRYSHQKRKHPEEWREAMLKKNE
ncbi:transcription factor grauzone-like [Phlebotomus argentipes]|uniref:transcription factor grauzone-like n=1 Tax=Phlebotomus argentipes TaxID=94469 RepID=UPI002892CE5E|nr:transcription factor grauzone-like [Phlebotomus argentipes]